VCRTHGVPLLLERSREGVDVELDPVAGFLLVELDRLAEAVEPGRLVDHNGHRRDLGGRRVSPRRSEPEGDCATCTNDLTARPATLLSRHLNPPAHTSADSGSLGC